MSMLLSFLFPPPPSLFVNAMSIISLTSLANAGLSELRGKHLRYSKFFNSANNNSPNKKSSNEITIPSRIGMSFLYAPAAVAPVVAFLVPGVVVGLRAQLLIVALAIHFPKRVFEALFIHQYSGRMLLKSAIPISLSYFLSTVTMIYAQCLSQDMPEPSIDLKYSGLALFLVGIAGNFYHHLLLSKLRQKEDKGYKIPKGGLFGLVICPHYLFEIIGFYGVSLIAQTMYSLSFTLGTTFYLMGRSWATRNWYEAEFQNFPKEVKALIPYIL